LMSSISQLVIWFHLGKLSGWLWEDIYIMDIFHFIQSLSKSGRFAAAEPAPHNISGLDVRCSGRACEHRWPCCSCLMRQAYCWQ